MKSRQLLSIVFSLIMIAGVSAGSAAYGQSDDLEEIVDILGDFCVLTDTQQSEFFSEHEDYAEYESDLAEICAIEDEGERDDALENFIELVIPETRGDDMEDEVDNGTDNEVDYTKTEDEAEHDLDDRLEMYCEMSEDEKSALFAEIDGLVNFETELDSFCDLEGDKRDNAIDEFVESNFPEVKDDHNDTNDDLENAIDDYLDMYSNKGSDNLREHLAMYCNSDDPVMAEKFQMIHDGLPEDLREGFATYCEMSEEEQNDFVGLVMDRMDEIRDHMKDTMSDFKDEHKMMVREMQERHEEISDHKMEYERFCKMSEDERAMSIDDPEKLTKISEWCNMTPDERNDYNKEHHDVAMDVKEKRQELLEKMKTDKDLSHRLRTMILENEDEDSDKKISELREKIREMSMEHDKKKSELKMKFKEHKSDLKFRFSELTDSRKSDIKERYQEMKEFKAELQLKSDSLTDEEKQELRAEFIEQAKDMQLAWITPRDQMSAGIEPDQIECREGYALVMKNSNGLPMCVKAKSAIKMIEKGYAVPVEPAN